MVVVPLTTLLPDTLVSSKPRNQAYGAVISGIRVRGVVIRCELCTETDGAKNELAAEGRRERGERGVVVVVAPVLYAVEVAGGGRKKRRENRGPPQPLPDNYVSNISLKHK